MSDIIIAYDVLRVINAKPLFAKDHYIRLSNSVTSVDPTINFSEELFLSHILKVIKSNNLINGNIKTIIQIDKRKKSYTIDCKEIPHHYPSDNDYQNGINTITYTFTRENPHNKIWNQELREITDKMIAANNIFEVLYVNKEGHLTEGSRSNLFFINNNELISAPSTEILLGVTRKFIIEDAIKTGLKLIEKKISLDEISNYKSAFISGTSPKILPVKKINKIKFDVKNVLLERLMYNFDIHIKKDIDNFVF
ncbi:MAG TPA: aminotransferase class IV [Bacteroidales bacterium]|nr:aminotransferase class IV [Bacteroidales bacterium]